MLRRRPSNPLSPVKRPNRLTLSLGALRDSGSAVRLEVDSPRRTTNCRRPPYVRAEGDAECQCDGADPPSDEMRARSADRRKV